MVAQMKLPAVMLYALLSTGLAHAGDMQSGRETYELHCSICHGDNGVSVDMTIPSFANGDRLFQMDQDLLRSIREGKELMPAFRGLLSDQEIRDVIIYLRSL
jgi:cytochrome c6